jgi:protocatechuate 3,4-dioxygenase beta subunit
MLLATPQIGDETPPLRLNRRSVLAAAAGAIGLAHPLVMLAQRQLVETGTPQLTLGPFYPLERGADQDWDMTQVAGRSGRAQGTVMELTGMVRAKDGTPVPGARLDIWQTNGLGRYHHPSDPSGAPLDPNFEGSAVVRADDEGRYRLRTVVPTPYGRRQRHIHFDVSGQNRRLITQMFFPGEPNHKDSLYTAIATDAQRELAVASAAGERDGARLFDWDIVLAGE